MDFFLLSLRILGLPVPFLTSLFLSVCMYALFVPAFRSFVCSFLFDYGHKFKPDSHTCFLNTVCIYHNLQK